MSRQPAARAFFNKHSCPPQATPPGGFLACGKTAAAGCLWRCLGLFAAACGRQAAWRLFGTAAMSRQPAARAFFNEHPCPPQATPPGGFLACGKTAAAGCLWRCLGLFAAACGRQAAWRLFGTAAMSRQPAARAFFNKHPCPPQATPLWLLPPAGLPAQRGRSRSKR